MKVDDFSRVHPMNHESCNNTLADGLFLGSSHIDLLMKLRSSFWISGKETLLNGVRFSANF